MKFTLLGEFSGLHYAIKQGLVALGHDVILISDGDKRKNISSDIRLDNLSPFLPQGRLNSIFSSCYRLKLPFSDHLSIISPLLLGGGRYIREFFSYNLLRRSLDRTNTSSLCAAGSDSFWLKFAKTLDYHPYDSSVDPKPIFSQFPTNTLNHYAAKSVDAIFGFTPDYYSAYKSNLSFEAKTFQLPMVGCSLMKSIPESYSPVKSKVVILFGSNKYAFKGGFIIEKALKRFHYDFQDVEIVTPAMCSYNEWFEYVRRCDILIDQCRTYSYGVNALLGMALGKIVLTGWHWPPMKVFNYEQPPMIHISPTVDSVYQSLFLAYTNIRGGIHKPELPSAFYDSYHSPIVVTQKFLSFVRNL